MRKADVNRRYRMLAIYVVTKGRREEGKAHITWDDLRKYAGMSWNTYAHELMVKGIIHFSNGFVYLSEYWAGMSPAEQMENIERIYPRR